MAEINGAYAVLEDEERRRQYDAQRALSQVKPVAIVEAPRRFDAWAPRERVRSDADVLDFGRYAGWRISDLAAHDPDYLRWLCRHSSGLRFREAIVRVLPTEPDLHRRANSVA